MRNSEMNRTPADQQARDTKTPELSASEWKVAEVLWDHPGLRGVQVGARLPKHLGWKQKTVNTFLARMVQKRFLRTEQSGRAFLYFPTIPREDLLRSAARDYLALAGSSGHAAAVGILHQEAELSPEDVRALRKKLKEMA